jgi:hypothetical protein
LAPSQRQVAPEIREALDGQLDEEAPLVPARRVLTEDDLAIAASDLTDRAGTIAYVPTHLEPSASRWKRAAR